ncbi:MAG: amino acid-binding protein [Propionibacteriaceae bacterium]|jgi:hypothetical protein|nr:amino acid-binding protein [Propionibacteriaceae bacterium]
MFLLRIELPETPGTLGRIATAMGEIGADIQSLEIVEHNDGYAIDDFTVDLPAHVLPDTLVSACQSVEGVHVRFLSRHSIDWGIESDSALLTEMAENPDQAIDIFVQKAPVAFRSSWAALLRRDGEEVTALKATDRAPDFATDGVSALGDLTVPRTFDLPAEWLPQWGLTIIALAPLGDKSTIVLGRQGGPNFLSSELTRLKHLASLASDYQ